MTQWGTKEIPPLVSVNPFAGTNYLADEVVSDRGGKDRGRSMKNEPMTENQTLNYSEQWGQKKERRGSIAALKRKESGPG